VRVSLSLLGGFQARRGSQPLTVPSRKARALLSYLALPPGRRHPREQLAALLWEASGMPKLVTVSAMRSRSCGKRLARAS
jgi:DNA-binding SARP family transcriptional activator